VRRCSFPATNSYRGLMSGVVFCICRPRFCRTTHVLTRICVGLVRDGQVIVQQDRSRRFGACLLSTQRSLFSIESWFRNTGSIAFEQGASGRLTIDELHKIPPGQGLISWLAGLFWPVAMLRRCFTPVGCRSREQY
jgi:hypothetical protein